MNMFPNSPLSTRKIVVSLIGGTTSITVIMLIASLFGMAFDPILFRASIFGLVTGILVQGLLIPTIKIYRAKK